MKILLGVSASISAYKAADIVRALVKKGAEVHVVMTQHATAFIPPLTLEVLSKHKVQVEVMTEAEAGVIQHITLAQTCDCFLLAPASANIIGKLAHGIADDLLSTLALALPPQVPKYIAPAMNTTMYQNPAVQRNLSQLKADGYNCIEPRTSELACGVKGKGALATLETIVQTVLS